MYKRIVLLKTHDKPALSRLLLELRAFPEQIAELEAVEIIADVGDRSLGYELGFILTFRDETVLTRWREHPLHAAFRPRLRALCEMLIFDYPEAAAAQQREVAHAQI